MQSWLRYVRLPFVSPSLSDISPLFWYVQFEKREAVYSIFLFRSFGSHALFSLTRITFQFPLSNHSLTTRKKGKEATSLAEIFALSSPRPSLSPKSAHITFGNKARIGIKDSFLKTRWDLGFEKEKKNWIRIPKETSRARAIFISKVYRGRSNLLPIARWNSASRSWPSDLGLETPEIGDRLSESRCVYGDCMMKWKGKRENGGFWRSVLWFGIPEFSTHERGEINERYTNAAR